MQKVNPSPFISNPVGLSSLGGVAQFLVDLVRSVSLEFHTHAIRLNKVVPNDGSETMNLSLTASTVDLASANLPTGEAPTAPNNGDVWSDGTNVFIQLGGVTKVFTLTDA
jgi:hypothetical protein